MSVRASARRMPARPWLSTVSRGNWDSAAQSVRVVSRSVVEVHLRARPTMLSHGFAAQARSMYRNLRALLRDLGVRPAEILKERIFLADIGTQSEELLEVREWLFDGAADEPGLRPALTLVQQPPARPGQLCEVQAFAMLPANGLSLMSFPLNGLPAPCSGRMVVEPDGTQSVWVSGLTGGDPGKGGDFDSRTAPIFLNADEQLPRWEFSFHDVARTWIYLKDMDATYGAFNGVRRRFFQSREVSPAPASTGIGGAPWPAGRECSLDLVAVRGAAGMLRTVPIQAPTMNEAPSYGCDFSRGMRVEKEDRSILYLSGTASIDTAGRVVAPGDVERQVERMLVNVEELLAGQQASYAQVVSAVTYLKRPQDLARLIGAFRRRGVPEHFPNTFCVADVCRPEWLCEMEAVAVLT